VLLACSGTSFWYGEFRHAGGNDIMNKPEAVILGMALGAGLTYLLDPDRGGRRRGLVRDKLVHA
jgi:hypothetical protein